VGPTRNVAFWNLPRDPSYDERLISVWRLYARLHQRLADYSYKYAQEAHETGMPIVRPLFLADPKTPQAWTNWWTYLYGPNLLVSPIWEKGKRTQEVYLPSGAKWREAWNSKRLYDGGQTITVQVDLHQIPLFIRSGSDIDVGNLEQEWRDAVEAAHTRPDLKALDADVKRWFDDYQKATHQ
jgi:alpha-D-xyloside xylohydrolase